VLDLKASNRRYRVAIPSLW